MSDRERQIQLSAEIQNAIEQYEEQSGMMVADIRIHRTGPAIGGVGFLTTVNNLWKIEPELQQS